MRTVQWEVVRISKVGWCEVVQSNDNANMNSTREMNHISGDETSVNCITEASQRSWSGDGKENLASSLKMEPKSFSIHTIWFVDNEGVFSQPVAGNPESGLSFTTPVIFMCSFEWIVPGWFFIPTLYINWFISIYRSNSYFSEWLIGSPRQSSF